MVTRCLWWRWTLVAAVLWNAGAYAARGEEYKSFESARLAGARYMSDGNLKKAQEPLEAALKLAPNDDERLRVYNDLRPCYRELSNPDKMIEACEFVLANSKHDAERSLTARSLGSFLHKRGKLDESRKRYETRLQKSPGDLVSLAMLWSLASIHYENRDKAKEYRAELTKVEQSRNCMLAHEEAKLIKSDPDQAPRHAMMQAVYYMRAGQHDKSVVAAKEAQAIGPSPSSPDYFWHAWLADVYIAADHPADAVPLLEKAITATPVAGYKKDCEQKLALAKDKAEEQAKAKGESKQDAKPDDPAKEKKKKENAAT